MALVRCRMAQATATSTNSINMIHVVGDKLSYLHATNILTPPHQHLTKSVDYLRKQNAIFVHFRRFHHEMEWYRSAPLER